MMANIEQVAAADVRTLVFVCSTSRVFGDGEMEGCCNPAFLFTQCEQTTRRIAVSIFQEKTK
jgi:hypothetical protein